VIAGGTTRGVSAWSVRDRYTRQLGVILDAEEMSVHNEMFRKNYELLSCLPMIIEL